MFAIYLRSANQGRVRKVSGIFMGRLTVLPLPHPLGHVQYHTQKQSWADFYQSSDGEWGVIWVWVCSWAFAFQTGTHIALQGLN